jgi:hypothetical protein
VKHLALENDARSFSCLVGVAQPRDDSGSQSRFKEPLNPARWRPGAGHRCAWYNPIMSPLVEQHRAQIEELCRKYRVKRLELFGSAARGDFDPAHSDVDFFYEFDPTDDNGLVDRFFGLIEDLETLLGVKVDLVSARHAKNPYFLEVANRNRITLYAA